MMAIGRTVRTNQSGSAEEDFAIETLTADFVNTIEAIFPDPTTAPTLLVSIYPVQFLSGP